MMNFVVHVLGISSGEASYGRPKLNLNTYNEFKYEYVTCFKDLPGY